MKTYTELCIERLLINTVFQHSIYGINIEFSIVPSACVEYNWV